MLADHRDTERQNKAAPGVSGYQNKSIQLLDEIILKMDDMAEQRCDGRNERSDKERQVENEDTQEQIRARKLSCVKVRDVKVSEEINRDSGTSSGETPWSGYKRKRDTPHSKDEESEWIQNELEKRGVTFMK